MNRITNPQISKLHVVLAKLHIGHIKADVIRDFTKGRTTSCKDLTREEAAELISMLSENLPEEKVKSAIWIMARNAGIIYGDSEIDNKINRATLDTFFKARGTVKKGLHEMSLEELLKAHRQIEAMVNNNVKNADKKEATRATKQLLKDLNLTVK